LEQNAKIYIAGHTGLIGSAIVRQLRSLGYSNIITETHKEMDLTERRKVEKFFEKENPKYVFLAAAKVGGIFANSTYPAEFIYENLMIQSNVIDLSYRYEVRKLLFFSSSCIYPKFCKQPMREEYLMTGRLEPTNEPFGVAKLAGLKMCQAYNRQYGTNFISIIPANVYGINDHFAEEGHVVASLIRKFHEAKVREDESVTIWGTGTPKREFFYVDDLVEACIFLMDKYNESDAINVGTGIGTTIAELAEYIKAVTGFTGRIVYDTSKPDGNPIRLLDTSRITTMGWKPKIPLKEGLNITYEWYKKSSLHKNSVHQTCT
jgi:GDP-L-fucose synthase